MEYFYVYIVSNIETKKQYVGEHFTTNLDDSYLGSGIYLNRAIKKYGKSNFKKEILEFCNSKEDAFLLQEHYITKFNTLLPNGYNISPTGGIWKSGGRHGEETKIKLRGPNPKKALHGEKNGMFKNGEKITGEKNGRFGIVLPDEIRKSFGRNQSGNNNVFFGKTHTSETLNQISNTLKNKAKIHCDYCGKDIDYRNFKRWHGENCKFLTKL